MTKVWKLRNWVGLWSGVNAFMLVVTAGMEMFTKGHNLGTHIIAVLGVVSTLTQLVLLSWGFEEAWNRVMQYHVMLQVAGKEVPE